MSWIGLAYVASASIAGLLYMSFERFGLAGAAGGGAGDRDVPHHAALVLPAQGVRRAPRRGAEGEREPLPQRLHPRRHRHGAGHHRRALHPGQQVVLRDARARQPRAAGDEHGQPGERRGPREPARAGRPAGARRAAGHPHRAARPASRRLRRLDGAQRLARPRLGVPHPQPHRAGAGRQRAPPRRGRAATTSPTTTASRSCRTAPTSTSSWCARSRACSAIRSSASR